MNIITYARKAVSFCILSMGLIIQSYAEDVEKIVGTGTTSSSVTPYNLTDGRGVCQSIYLASEIGATGILRSISYYVAVAGEISSTRDVYVTTTSSTSFSSVDDYYNLPENNGTLSLGYWGYSESIASSTGWETIDLATPLLLDGTKNLVVVVQTYSGSSTTVKYRYTAKSGMTLRKTDGDNAISGASNAYITSTYRPNVKFTISTPDFVDGYYQLEDTYDVQWFANQVNSGNNEINGTFITSGKNITLPSDWTPIGTESYPYKGTFKGNGVYFTLNDFSGTDAGIFGYIAEEGTVQDVNLWNGSITGSQLAGGIVASNAGTLYNCLNRATISGSSSEGTGGICGVNTGTIDSCINRGTVTSTSYGVGGICGTFNGGSITNCTNEAAIQGLYGAGGLCGYAYADITIDKSYNSGNITGTSSGYYGVGGIIGRAGSSALPVESTLSNCGNQGTVQGSYRGVGGIIGYSLSTSIDHCYNVGTVASTACYVGSLSGFPATVSNSYYIAGTATDGNSVAQNAVGTSTLGSVSTDEGSETKTDDEFRSGEVCYLLNGSVSGGSPWGHAIGDYPTISNKKVYTDIPDQYTNTEVTFSSSFLATLSAMDGDGSKSNPFTISNYEELVVFQQLVNYGYCYICGTLTADIVVNDSILTSEGLLRSDYKTADLNVWKPMGSSSAYRGTFDGDGHTITGIYIYSSSDAQAFFAKTESGAIIQNLTLSDCYVKGGSGVAMLAATVIGTTITNCHVNGYVDVLQGVIGASGIAAMCDNVTVSQCSCSGTISAPNVWYVGGIVAYASAVTVSQCYNTASIQGSLGVGGIAGCLIKQSSIEYCYNTGLIQRTDSMSGDSYGVGGVCGMLKSQGSDDRNTIKDSYNIGNVTGINAGGVCGSVGGYVTNCYNAGSVMGTASIGGVAGITSGSDYSITYCYYDSNTCSAKGIANADVSDSAYPHTTLTLCNETLSTALRDTYSSTYWQAGTTSTASTEIITEDNVLGYKIIGTYPSLIGVGEAQNAIVNYVNIGTADDPEWITDFTPIYTIDQLKAVANDLDATYVVMNNLYESSNLSNGVLKTSPTKEWTPIGTSSEPFTGRFYGRGFTIYGLYMNGEYDYAALFGKIQGAALVSGVKTAQGSFTNTKESSYAAGIVGYASSQYIGTTTYEPTITYCENANNVSGVNVAGICSDGRVSYCVNSGTIVATNNAGGIVCNASLRTISNCYNYGSITATNVAAGIAYDAESVYDCYNLGSVTGATASGIVGGGAFGVSVKRSYNASDLSATTSAGNIIAASGLSVGTVLTSYYANELNDYTGIFESADEEGAVEGITVDDLCLSLPEGFSSDVWSVKEPVIKDNKKYLYYPYLQWLGEEYVKVGTYRPISTVVLNTNGGTCTPLTQYIEREGATLPQDVERDGYTFGGWHTNASCTSDEVFEIPVTATGEQTFYAKWTANDYAISLSANGGNITSGNVTSYKYGTYTLLPNDVVRTGYTFKGWYPYESCDMVLESYSSSRITTAAKIVSVFGLSASEALAVVDNIPSVIVSQIPLTDAITQKQAFLKDVSAEISFESLVLSDGEEFCDLVLESCGNNKINVIKLIRKYLDLGLGDAKTLADAAPTTILTSVPLATAEAMKSELDALGDVISSYANRVGGNSISAIYSTDMGDKYFGAKWEANTYSVNLQVNGGVNTNIVEEYVYGVGAALPDDTEISREGYTFAGWYVNSNLDGSAVEEITTTDYGDKTYYAKWNVESYAVTLNENEGSINNGNVTSYTYGIGVTLPTDVTRIGYTFGGWYDNSSCSGSPVLSIALNAIDDKEFWAKWDTINYTITYNANEGVFATTPAESYKYGDEVTLPVPTREGYTFAGWYNNSNLVGTEFTQIESTETGNKEFWAKWDVNTYTVSLDAKGGDINSGNVASYTYNVLTILPQDVTKVGHTFEGWFDLENQKVTQISKGTIGDVTFTAKWTAKTYSVTLQANNGTINSGNVTSYTYGLGATLPEDVTKTGYEFLGWFDNSSYDGGKVTNIADNEIGNKNFWAKWTAASYDVTLDANGGTINSNAIERYTYGVGAVLPTDVTKIGYTFKGWKNEENEDALEITSADYGKKTFTAQWEKANYDITYNANGGSINDSYETTYKYGNEITLPTDVTKEGNEFLGWYDNPNFTGEAVSGITTADYGDKTYYAQWSANTYSVTLEPNGGTVNAGAITGYTYGVVASLPTNVTRDGYTFTGWYSDEECEGEVVSIISSTETGNKTFYAGWSNSAYSVTLHTNDGIITSGNVTSYTYGTSVVLPTEIEKTGYTFGGWYDNSSYAGDSVTEISADATGNKTYYAKWAVNTYAITLNTNGGTINSGMVASYVYGNGANLPTDVTKTGNTFAGWYADEELTGDQTIRIDEYATGDKTYYAKWTANEYTITYEVVGGSIEDAVYATNYTYGEAVNLPSAVTKSGHTFSGWYTNSAYEGSAITSLSETEYGNRTYYAKWTVNTYEVTLQTNEGTVNNGNVSSYTYGVGATLPSDVTKTGYTFMGWYDNDEFAGESVSSIASNATGDKVYYAKWSINNYAVTLNANGGQINSGAVTSYEFDTEVLLPVDVTKAGHTFGGWYDNANLTGESCTEIVAGSTGNKTYYAKWTVNSYAVTLHVNEGTINRGNVTGYIYGSTVILPSDVTKTGNTFGGWYESETFEGDAVSTITASDLGDKTYYAKWTANVYDIILVVNEGTINAGMVENYTYGEGATLPTEVTKEGYSFGGWYSNSSYIGGSVLSIANNDSGDKQYWAKWTINEYEVSAEAENGTVEGTGSYEYKSTATLKATASEGYEFTGWSTGSTETKIQIVVTSDTTVTANFKEKEKVLAVGELEIPTLKTEREAAAIDLSGLFMTSEGSEVSYSASSSAPNVVSASVSEGKLYLTVYEYEGEAEITVKATLPNGEENVVKATATVVLACNIKVDETITNVSCYGQADGEIALKVTNAAEPYTTFWVSESVTGDTLRGIPASDTYNVEITDAEGCTYTGIYSVTEPSEMKVTGVVKSPTCGNADGSIDITVVGADVASYAWSNGKDTEDISTLSKGEYSVTVTNEATGCQVSDSYVLTEPESPVVTVSNVVATACNEANGAVTISVNEEGLIYSWSNNAQTKNLTGVRAGEYTLSVVNPETNCTASIDVTVPSIALKQPEIALVTVSEQTGKNLVVWLKENTNLIDYYTIYRENDEADMYEKLATVPYSELSVYEDEEADPNIRAWRYRITATDVCGTETEQSDHHKTMHITKNAGADGVSNNLIWDEYEGLEFSTFIVMCKHKENGKVVTDTLTTLPSNVTSYTDALPVDNIMSYYVGIKLPSEINPKTQFLKAESGPFALAISNIAEAENEEGTGIETLETDVAVYAVGHTVVVEGAEGETVCVYDVNGQKLSRREDVSQREEISVKLTGVYLVTVGDVSYVVIIR